MTKTVTVRLAGEDEKIYYAVEQYFNRGPARLRDSEVVRACIRSFYENEIPPDDPSKKTEKVTH